MTKAAVEKTVKEPKKKPLPKKIAWSDVLPGQIAQDLSEGTHFSSKTIHTSATVAGVRMAAGEPLDLPYVGFSTTRLDRRIVDYIRGAVSAKVFNQASNFVEGRALEIYENISEEQLAILNNEVSVLDKAFVTGDDNVDPRLRQVLFPLEGGSFAALTPLHSSPFSRQLDNRLRAEKDRKDSKHRMKALLAIGGSNSQNAGRHANPMREVMVFFAPQESMELRQAYAIFHKGANLRQLLPRELLIQYAVWRENQANTQAVSNSASRAEEKTMVKAIVQSILGAAKSMSDKQPQYAPDLGARTHEKLGFLARGLLEPDLRNKAWTDEFATKLIDLIEKFQIKKDGAYLAETGALRHLEKTIKGAV